MRLALTALSGFLLVVVIGALAEAEPEPAGGEPEPAAKVAPAPALMTPTVGGSTLQGSLEMRPSGELMRWMPVAVGKRWTYTYVRERVRAVDSEEPVIEILHGTRVDEVVAARPDFAPDALEVQSVVTGRVEGAENETVETVRSFLQSNGSSFRLLALEATDPFANTNRLVRFTPPLELLRADAGTGVKWPVGVQKLGDLTTELEGEILGIQDAQTPAGLYEKCLVVRYNGRVSGTTEAYGVRIEVPEGLLVILEWYAPGVGRVLAKEELNQIMRLSNGSTIKFSQRVQYALQIAPQK